MPIDTGPIIEDLVRLHGEAQHDRIRTGVSQAAARWRPEDGDDDAFAAMARDHFESRPERLDALFDRLEAVMEQIDGHLHEAGCAAHRGAEVEDGPGLPLDALLAGWEPRAHLIEDLFRTGVAFVVLLNFPLATAEEKDADGAGWSRRRWAEVRLAEYFSWRVPAEVQQRTTAATAAADRYIDSYRIPVHRVTGPEGESLFEAWKCLLSHWALRAQIREGQDGTPEGLLRQRVIVLVMERIVTQEIPLDILITPRARWNPWTNLVTYTGTAPAPGDREPDTRYRCLLDCFRAAREADRHTPEAPTELARSFETDREMSEVRVTGLLREVLESPLAPRVAAWLGRRLGRPLEPQDLWYDRFCEHGPGQAALLDEMARRHYRTLEDFARSVPDILHADLGFSLDDSRLVAGHVLIEQARGCGHSMEAMLRGCPARLRAPSPPGGLGAEGLATAMHELGHATEQVLSLEQMDHSLLAGVPNTAFTEAIAFWFQAQVPAVLGLGPVGGADPRRALQVFWEAREIAGVALVDIGAWHWMYDHPEASPADLREAVVAIARETWDRYYEPLLGGRGSPLLGIYSHMISNPLYLADYPLGHLIAFQIEEHLRRHDGTQGREIARMVRCGNVAPDLWMRNATGAPVGAAPLLAAVEGALQEDPG
jgi:hypothetical protein